MIEIYFLDKFKKHYQKLTKVEQKQFDNKLKLFVNDKFYPSLRTKAIMGSDNIYEFSVNMDIRVLWEKTGENSVTLLDIGHHDILK